MRLGDISIVFGAAASVVATASPKNWIPKFENLVTFGDSYTDENRFNYFLANGGQPPPPGLLLPPSNSTLSGGITWPRFVSSFTGAKLYNYAVSGAVCSNAIIYRFLDALNIPFPDVVYELDAFIADTKYKNKTTGANTLYTNRKADNTVYSMWIGTNDLGVGAFLTNNSVNGATIPNYVDCMFEQFDRIYEAGGKYFVLFNTAPLEFAPVYAKIPLPYLPDAPPLIASLIASTMKEYTKTVDALLLYRLPVETALRKRYPGAKFALFDVNTLMTDIYHHPEKYLAIPANVTGQYQVCDASGTQCVNDSLGLDHFLWFDSLHPGEKVHEVLAKEFMKVAKGVSGYAMYF